MKYLISAICLLIVSCEDWNDYYQSTNQKPTILIKANDSEKDFQTFLSDSLKLNNSYIVALDLTDDYKTDDLTINYFSKDFKGEFMHQDNVIYFKPSIAGKIEIGIICKDVYQNSDTAILKLIVFNNITPIAALDFSYNNQSLTLNATNSYDPDKKYGGGLENYEFYIGGNTIPWDKPVIEITTSILTTTEIGVRVQDNEGAWSNWV